MSPPAPQSMVRTSAGHFFLVTTNPMEPLHFDQDGGFVGQLGRRGEGPGEHRSPMAVIHGRGDTVWVFDVGLQRRTAWSPRGEYLTSARVPAFLSEAAFIDDGRLVLSGPLMTDASMGLPLHLFDPDGELVSSFGTEMDVSGSAHIPGWIRRMVAPGSEGTVWAAYRHQYTIERYAYHGALRTTLQRDIDWFPARDPTESTTLAEDGPQPQIRALVEDDDGYLRVLLHLPGENWRAGIGERELQPGFESAGVYWTPVRDHERVYDFAIEVIDPATGELLISHRQDGLALGWLDTDHIATYRQDEMDVPIIDVYRVVVTVR